MPKKKTLPVEIAIARSNLGTIHIRVTDETSRTMVVEVTLTAEEFGNAVTNLVTTGLPAEFGNLNRVGRVRHNRTINVFVPTLATEAVARECVNDVVERLNTENPGWNWDAHYMDAMNLHRRNNDGTYRVTFVGWEPPAGT